MAENKITIPVTDNEIIVTLFGENSENSVFELDKAEAIENGESPFQIMEGQFYEYKISPGYCFATSEVVTQSKVNPSSGRISPNIFVGTLSIDILDLKDRTKQGVLQLEVQSQKLDYRKDYRYMLEDITDKCTDLLMQHASPVSQFFEVDFNADTDTLYQRFAFIKSVIDSEEFNDSVHKILSAPVTRWKEIKTQKDIRSIRRINNSALRQIAGAPNRIDIPPDHTLSSVMTSVPVKIIANYKTETVDTPENRFVKHALSSFLFFCVTIRSNNRLNENSRLKREAIQLEDKLEQHLSHSVFKEISLPTTLPLNSPVLQRKEGYREILREWLMFDLAAKLIWHGGDDVYRGGKRDVAVLYEYWLFFKLLDLVKEVFKIEPEEVKDLIKQTNDGLGLQLKQGRHLPVKGIYDAGIRNLNIEFSYNKTFSGLQEYPESGSWTRSLRPDYTLTVWPIGIEQEQAEKEELIVHIHFDAKYKIENLKTIFGTDDNLEEEKEEQKKGTFKRADILKMHTYRDAIRRTAGAYVLYPGSESDKKHGFHELLPGLGAFAIKPSKQNDGTDMLKEFLYEVVQHFLNRASQREKMSLKTYETHLDKNSNELHELLPETYGENRSMLPDDTFVLVGYYKSKEHLEWINKNNLYNARTGSGNGSIKLNPETAGAKYLLLHGPSNHQTGYLYKLTGEGPRLFSNDDLIRKHYPTPSQKYYLVYEIFGECEIEFRNKKWDVKKLDEYQTAHANAWPFSVSLTCLMKAVVK